MSFLDDAEFRSLLQTVTYVPVLRRFEGFEMMGVEALFSGTRPIVYEAQIESKPYRWGHATLQHPSVCQLQVHQAVRASAASCGLLALQVLALGALHPGLQH